MFVNLGSFAHLRDIEWVRQGLSRLPGDDARLLARRWGLDGGPPHSIAELAREEGITPIAMVRRLQEAEARLLRAMGMGRPPAGPGPRPGRGAGSAGGDRSRDRPRPPAGGWGGRPRGAGTRPGPEVPG
ncbi:MAG TPA: hypothetical protein VIL38_08945 [Thermaerobacter sp.]